MHDLLRNHKAWKVRRVLSLSAWTLLASVIVGYLISAGGPSRYLERLPPGSPGSYALYTIVVIAGIAGMTAWISGISYALLDQRRNGVPRWLLLAILIVGNFAASFFYYFLFVHWQPKPA